MQFLVFSDDWGEHPSSCQHLFRIIAASNPTIWVNTVGLRQPQLTFDDARRSLRKVSAMLGIRKPQSDLVQKINGNGNGHHSGPTVRIPLMTPFHSPSWLAAWNSRSLLQNVQSAIKELDFDKYTVVTTTPSVCDVISKLSAHRVIYYCVDDFSEWPGMEKSLIKEMENKLLAQVDLIVCSSSALYERFKHTHPTYLLTHGVDVDLFTDQPAHEHALLHKIPEPRVGYFGSFDGRSDTELLLAVAQAMPQISFVITGPAQGRFHDLKHQPNIYFTGPVPYAELPQIVRGWKACLLPYRVNALTTNINPLKLKEYLASKKPVIATPLPEVRDLSQYLRIAESVDDWCQAIADAVNGKWIPDGEAIEKLLSHESWPGKAELFMRICQVA